jgi:hypothetical protein
VSNCVITAWEIVTFPLPGELLMWQGSAPITIIDDQFTHDEDTSDGIFTLAGTFDSEDFSYGTLFFPKGFSVFGAILPRDVTMKWTATPEK